MRTKLLFYKNRIGRRLYDNLYVRLCPDNYRDYRDGVRLCDHTVTSAPEIHNEHYVFNKVKLALYPEGH